MKTKQVGKKWCALLVMLAMVVTALPVQVFADMVIPLPPREREEVDETYQPGVIEEMEDWEGDDVEKESKEVDLDWQGEVQVLPTITEINGLGDALRDDGKSAANQQAAPASEESKEEKALLLPIFVAEEILLEEQNAENLSQEDRFVFLEALCQLPDDRQQAATAAEKAVAAYARLRSQSAAEGDLATTAAFFQVEETYLDQALTAGLGLYTIILDYQYLLDLECSAGKAQQAVLEGTVQQMAEEAGPQMEESEEESAQYVELERLSSIKQNEDEIGSNIKEDTMTAPFSHTEKAYEQISLSGQNLQYSVNDVVIPGKSGMDLVIKRQYNSNEAAYYETYGRLSYKNGRKLATAQVNYNMWERQFEIGDDDEVGDSIRGSRQIIGRASAPVTSQQMEGILRYRTIVRPRRKNYYSYQYYRTTIDLPRPPESNMASISLTRNDTKWDMGTGWSLGFSHVEYVSAFDEHVVLHLADGRSFAVLDNAFNNLGMYFYEDVSYTKRVGKLDGVEFTSHVDYADGRTEYFDKEGRLVLMRDKFRNSIKFAYKKAGNRNEITITDSLGQVTKLYNEDTKTGYNKIIELPDKQKITYVLEENKSRNINTKQEKTKGQYSEYVLAAVTDEAGQTTRYAYDDVRSNAEFHASYTRNKRNLMQGNPFEDGNYTPNYYAALKQITYPTGLQTHYEYYPRYNSWGGVGMYQDIAIKARYDKQGVTKYNEQRYEYSSQYTHQGMDGSVLYNADDYHNESGEKDGLYSFNRFTATQTDVTRKTKTKYTFNNSGLCTKEEVTNTSDGKLLLTTETSYNIYQAKDHASPATVKTSDFQTTSGKAQVTTELYEYDHRGNVTAYWSPLAEGDKKKTEYKTTLTYSNRNNMPLSKTYKTDKNTTVVEKNELAKGSKSIESKTVEVNGVVKSKSEYTHDDWGNVLTAKDYVSLQPEETIDTEFVYHNGTFPVKQTVKNVKDADGKSTGSISSSLTYDMYGRVKSVTDGNGHVTRYTHDKAGRVTSIRYPDNKEKKFIYDVGRNYTIATDQRGFQMKYQYDRAGNLNAVYEMPAKKGDPEVKLLTYVYDAVNRLVREENHASTYGSKTYYTYRQDDLLTQKKVVDNNKKTLYTETNQIYADQVKQTIAGDSAAPSQTTVQYLDKYGRVTRSGVVLGREELLDTYSYNYVGQPLTVKHRRANKEKYKESFTGKMEYDHTGQVVKATNVLNETATKGYDALGREVWSMDPKNNAERTNQKTVVTYDQMGRVIQKKTPFEKGAYATEKYYYDKNGNLVRTLVSNNLPGQAASFARTDYAYNKKNELVKVVSYDQGAAANTVSYEYDAAGNMTAMTTGNGTQKTVYSYDRFHRVAAITDPQGMTESYTYDKNGYLTAKTDRNGVVTRFAYDGLGREVSRTAEVPGKTQTERTGYAATGAVSFVENDTIRLSYTYDQLGRVTAERDNKGTVLAYTYDAASNMTGLSVSVNGKEVKKAGYVYDKLDRLSQVKNGNTVAATYQYDKNGNRASLTYGNGVNTTYSYNLANLPVTLTNKAGTKTLSSYQYGYQLDGNQRTKTEHNGRKVNYTYDDLGRLVSEAESGAADAITKRYAFDGANNRAAMTVTGAEAYTVGYQYDKNNRLLSTAKKEGSKTSLTEYFYDNNGNQISESTSLTATPMKLLELLEEGADGLALTPGQAAEQVPGQPEGQTLKPGAEQEEQQPAAPGESHDAVTTPEQAKETQSHQADTKANTDVESAAEAVKELESVTEAVNALNTGNLPNVKPTVGAANLIGNLESGTAQSMLPEAEVLPRYSLTETAKSERKAANEVSADALAGTGVVEVSKPAVTAAKPEAPGPEPQPGFSQSADLADSDQPQNAPEKDEDDKASKVEPKDDDQVISDDPTEHPEQAERLREEAAPLVEPQLTLANDAAQFRTYRYDGFNRLVKTESGGQTAVYTYRPDGLRYSKKVGAEIRVHIWEGSKIGLELDGAGNVVDSYLNGLNLIQSKANGYYIYNGHGDVVQRTNGSGQVTKEYTYDAFGNERKSDAADTNPFRYCGEYFDKETGSIYLRARYYDPGIGRFGTEDPIRDGLNWYTYCGGNPVKFIDPSGLAYYDSQGNWCYEAWEYSGKGNVRHDDPMKRYLNGEITDTDPLFVYAMEWWSTKGEQKSLKQFDPGDNGENYNRYDPHILAWTNYWNKQLGTNIDANDMKALMYIESKVGYYNGGTSNGSVDVFQVLDGRNPAIQRLAAIGNYSEYEGRAIMSPDGYGLFRRLYPNGAKDSYNKEKQTISMSVAGGILWYIHKGSPSSYNGGGDANYTSKFNDAKLLMK